MHQWKWKCNCTFCCVASSSCAFLDYLITWLLCWGMITVMTGAWIFPSVKLMFWLKGQHPQICTVCHVRTFDFQLFQTFFNTNPNNSRVFLQAFLGNLTRKNRQSYRCRLCKFSYSLHQLTGGAFCRSSSCSERIRLAKHVYEPSLEFFFCKNDYILSRLVNVKQR